VIRLIRLHAVRVLLVLATGRMRLARWVMPE